MFVLFAATSYSSAQRKAKEDIEQLFAELRADEKALADCTKTAEKEQIEKFGRVLPRIGGHCFSGCPVKLVKPSYPAEAKRLKLKGQVVVETVVDESGNVVYAEFSKGNSIFRSSALAAAYASKYQPQQACGMPIKFRWTIKFTFGP